VVQLPPGFRVRPILFKNFSVFPFPGTIEAPNLVWLIWPRELKLPFSSFKIERKDSGIVSVLNRLFPVYSLPMDMVSFSKLQVSFY
jgi:hypothetical protein